MGRVVFVDVDTTEERQVEEPANVLGCLHVSGVAVARQVEYFGQFAACLFVGRAGSHQLLLDTLQLVADAVLLGLEEVDGDRAGVVGFEQFLALGGEVGALLLESGVESLGVVVQLVELGERGFFDVVAQRWRERHRAVLVLDELLDEAEGHVLSGAVGRAALPSRAGEVLVAGAMTVRCVDHQQS
ncbi:hypothetical protein [Nocardioides zeae]|uniref:hypothetical protein n=1 Tax=Nocardioides zeae TaxID=1457234 RepID=UPI001F515268|nr:hypothetical protein [Nocardioides zeae]